MRGRAGSRCGATWLAIVSVGLSSLLLASCVKPTVFPRYLTVADVINNVKCELFDAILASYPESVWLSDWTAKFVVSLQVFRQGSVAGDLALVVPYHMGMGKFTLGLTGKFDKTGKSRIAIDFDAEKNLRVFMAKDRCAFRRNLSTRRDIAGNTGLDLWFGNVIKGVTEANIVKQATGFTYTLEFVTTHDGNIKPAFESTYPDLKIFRGNFDLRRHRQDTNSLTVAFAPFKPSVPFAKSDLGLALERIRATVETVSRAQEKLSGIDAGIAEAEREKATALADEKVLLERRAEQSKVLDEYRAIATSGEARSLSTLPSATVQPSQAREAIPQLNRDIAATAEELGQARAKASEATAAIERAQETRRQASRELEAAREEIRDTVERDATRLQWLRAAPASGSTEQEINQLLLRDAIRDIPR
jgi:hypothetical protein